MAELDPRLPGTQAAALGWVASIPGRHRAAAATRSKLERQITDLVAHLTDETVFAPVVVPLALAGKHVVPVAAACTAFFLAVDSPEDREGTLVLLASAQEFLCELDAAMVPNATRTLAVATTRLAAGRPEDAMACYAQLAGIGAGLSDKSFGELWEWGVAVGAARHDDARRILSGLWLPWGARPLLEAVIRAEPFPPVRRRINDTSPEGTKIP